jgi:hypothetical protein
MQNTEEQRREQLGRLKYQEVARICQEARLNREGGKAAMIARILAREFPPSVAPNIVQEDIHGQQHREAPLVQEERRKDVEQVPIVRGEEGRGNVDRLWQEMQSMKNVMERYMDSQAKMNENLIGAIESHGGPRTEMMKYWPERRLDSVILQQEYDECVQMGRTLTSLRLKFPQIQEVQSATLAVEKTLGLRATKVVVAERDGWEIARALHLREEGTFMESWEPKIERLNKSLGKRNKREDTLETVGMLSKRRKQNVSSIICFGCGASGHKRSECKKNNKVNQMENQQVNISQP